jgi:uncharacterized cupredoxin-like copper-binding protein
MTKMLTYTTLLLSLTLTAGCSNAPESGGQQPASSNTTPASSQATVNSTPTMTAPTATAAKGMVIVKLTEYKIEMPTSVPAGATTFSVTNAGKQTHSFEVEGNGIETELEMKLKAGESGMLQVDLKPGAYKVYCPVDGHKTLGMSLNLTVKS